MPNARVSAKDDSLPTLTRRSLLAGSASLAATTLSPGAPMAQPIRCPDAELTALGARFEQALSVYEAARNHFNDCEERYLTQGPDPPQALTSAGPLGALLDHDWCYWSARELRALLRDPDHRGDWPAADAILRIALAYEARERRFRRKTGLRAAERAHEAATDAVDALAMEIIETSARTLVGFAVKARAVKAWGKPEWWSENDSHADPYARFAADIIDRAIASQT
jgi:hypothetical protein